MQWRKQFIDAYLKQESSLSELCRRFGIRRTRRVDRTTRATAVSACDRHRATAAASVGAEETRNWPEARRMSAWPPSIDGARGCDA